MQTLNLDDQVSYDPGMPAVSHLVPPAEWLGPIGMSLKDALVRAGYFIAQGGDPTITLQNGDVLRCDRIRDLIQRLEDQLAFA